MVHMVWGYQVENGRLGRGGGLTVGAGSSRGTTLSNWRPILRKSSATSSVPGEKPVCIDALLQHQGKPN
jgi:hypothetical protein